MRVSLLHADKVTQRASRSGQGAGSNKAQKFAGLKGISRSIHCIRMFATSSFRILKSKGIKRLTLRD